MRRHKRKPDPAYLIWVKSAPCVVCWLPDEFSLVWMADVSVAGRQRSQTEVAHVGDRGLMQKCSDRETIPLCAEHHRTGKDAHHVLGKRFWAHHGLDRDAMVAELQRRYDAEVAAA